MGSRRTGNDNGDLSPEQREELLRTLKSRFEKNMNRHNGLEWARVQAKLEANAERLWSLNEMERTGGELGRCWSCCAVSVLMPPHGRRRGFESRRSRQFPSLPWASTRRLSFELRP